MLENEILTISYYSIVEPMKSFEYPATLNAYLKMANGKILITGQTAQPSSAEIGNLDRNSLEGFNDQIRHQLQPL